MHYIKFLNINSLGYGISFIHKLHPLNKLFVLIINLIIVFNLNAKELLYYIIFLIILMLLTCISVKAILRLLIFLAITMIGFVIMIFLLNFNNKFFLLTIIFLKILSMILPLIFYSLTTPLKESIYTCELIFYPLKYFKINTNGINLMLNIVLAYIPLMLKEFDNIFLIKASKGEDIKAVNVFKKIKIIYDSLFSVLVNAFLKANEMVNAILIRRFEFSQTRSRFITYKVSVIDYLVLSLFIILIASLIII